MTQNKFLFWQKWLTYSNVMIIVVGFLVAFAGNSFLFELHNVYTKEVFFNGNEFSPEVLKMKNWLFGIIGATIVGFHVLMLMISENAFKKKEKWAHNAMWLGLLSWFCIDSFISVYYSAIYNVWIINLFALVVIGLPLLITRKEFYK